MSEFEYTEDPAEVERRVDALAAEIVDSHIANGKTPRTVHAAQASLQNEVHRVYFRAGLLACREYMARFVAAESPTIAASIRANWWPGLGEDPGGPRRLHWNEVADGGEDGPWTPRDPGVSVEALPVALNFLCATSRTTADDYEASVPNRKPPNVGIEPPRSGRLE
jgi:hypothetical protein